MIHYLPSMSVCALALIPHKPAGRNPTGLRGNVNARSSIFYHVNDLGGLNRFRVHSLLGYAGTHVACCLLELAIHYSANIASAALRDLHHITPSLAYSSHNQLIGWVS
jgi:hypothetical protein